MENGIIIKDGREFDKNGFEISRQGSTSYVGVIRQKTKCKHAKEHHGEYEYWAYRQSKTDSNYMLGLYVSKDLGPCVWVANEFRKNAAINDDSMENFGTNYPAFKEGRLWGQQFDVPTEFDYELYTPETLAHKVKKAAVGKVTKKVKKEDNITEEYVAKAVNTILGSKVDVKKRIKIKDMVVANTEFYRTPEDVTAYVNDLVKYNFK